MCFEWTWCEFTHRVRGGGSKDEGGWVWVWDWASLSVCALRGQSLEKDSSLSLGGRTISFKHFASFTAFWVDLGVGLSLGETRTLLHARARQLLCEGATSL